tara:strand:- start:116 stop:838 length:723 start_codon:yes stop_codon:yes gene_type:complete
MWRLRGGSAACVGLAAGAYLATCDAAMSLGGGGLSSAKVLSRDDVAATRWLKLQTLTYQDPVGRERKWDVCQRTTRSDSAAIAGVDAVVVLALMRSKNSPEVETLLVQQFRPPVNKVTIELPAGLIDKGETAEVAALRELKEETGYVGTAATCSGPLAMSPGLTDESVKLVVCDIDMDLPENINPVQQLEESEFIRVLRVPVRSLSTELSKLEAEGAMPMEGLHLLAVGLQLGWKRFLPQ